MLADGFRKPLAQDVRELLVFDSRLEKVDFGQNNDADQSVSKTCEDSSRSR
jgi:hypothetical protein